MVGKVRSTMEINEIHQMKNYFEQNQIAFIYDYMDSPASLEYRKEKLIQNLKKTTRLGFEPPTSSVAGGLSKHLAFNMSCERKFNKHHNRESGDSIKMK